MHAIFLLHTAMWDALRLAVVWMSITFQLAGFSLHLFRFTPTPSFCFSSRLSSQASVSFLTISLTLFSYFVLIAGLGCLMAAVVASLTRQSVLLFSRFENLPFGMTIDLG